MACPLNAVDYSGVMYCNTVYKPGSADMRGSAFSCYHRGSEAARRGRRECATELTFFSNTFCSVLVLNERLSFRGHSGKASHGPPCERAEPPVCGPDQRPGSAAPQPGKGEYHTRSYSFTYLYISLRKQPSACFTYLNVMLIFVTSRLDYCISI